MWFENGFGQRIVWAEGDEPCSWAGLPCILVSLERVTNVLFWKCYTESLSSTHRIIWRVLRSHTVKKTVYPSVSQIDLTTGNYLLPSNTYQDISIPQNRVGEKKHEKSFYWFFFSIFIVVVLQLLSHVQLFVTSWTAAHQALLSSKISSLLKFMSTGSVMLSNHLILCCPLLFWPSIFPSIRVFFRVSSSHQVAKVFDSGSNPGPLHWELGSLSHWTTRQVP